MLALGLILGLGGEALAQSGRGRVLLLMVPEADDGWPDAEVRVNAELSSLGFEVVPLAAPGEVEALTMDDAVALLEANDGDMALVLQRPGRLTDGPEDPIAVYTRSPPQRLQVGRERIRDPSSEEQLALLAVELVYSALVKATPPPPPPDPPPPPPPPPAPPPQLVPGPWALRAGPWLGGTPEESGAVGGVLLGAARYFGDAGVAMRVDLPLLPLLESNRRGEAAVFVSMQQLSGLWSARLGRLLDLQLSLGAGALEALAFGDAKKTYRERNEVGITGFVSTSASSGIRLNPVLRLRLELRAGLTLPDQVVLRMAGAPVASLGQPLLDASVALERRPLRRASPVQAPPP